MKDQAPTLLKKIRNKETMPMHWYSCKRIHHRMGTGVERLKEIDAANLKIYYLRFFLSLQKLPAKYSYCDAQRRHDKCCLVSLADTIFAVTTKGLS